jgi:predicted PhzF superfamily epimerase YddE/YHI9
VQLPFYRLDAFTHRAFGGNPAAVVPLQRWLDDSLLQAIAAEENVPATAFVASDGEELRLRWFAPASELELCGHATLATAHVLFNRLYPERDRIPFVSGVGRLEARRDGPRVALDFPALPPQHERPPEDVGSAIGVAPTEVWEAAGGRGLAVLADAAAVRDLRPNAAAISALPFSALIVTARGFDGDCDFVSRYFAPKHGIAEDFVTGSAHCVLTPYWARVLAKPRLFARQLSSRGGELWVEDCGDRVRIAGECVPTAEGTLLIP